MNPSTLALAISSLVFAVACGGSSPTPPDAPKATSASASARPTCDAIDEACDPHEGKGGVAKECHDLAEASATTEATCLTKKDACLAACPKK